MAKKITDLIKIPTAQDGDLFEISRPGNPAISRSIDAQSMKTYFTGEQGPQGFQGPQGVAGSNGTNGINGTNGPQGSQGVQGPQGLTGSFSGTLVEGYNINITEDPVNIFTIKYNVHDNDIENWTGILSPNTNSWRGVCYGNGMFVSVSSTGVGNRVMTSPDGRTWTSRTSLSKLWGGVCYGDGLFVAVGQDGGIMYSNDGISWIDSSVSSIFDITSVCFGESVFVAVCERGSASERVLTSSDGITWSPRTSPTLNWKSVCYGNGIFVAVSESGTGNRVMTSPDGIVWTSQSSASNNDWQSVCYGNGLFVAVSITGSGNRVMTSPDGIVWTSQSSASNNDWSSICYGNGLFVAVSYSGAGNRVMTSPDGIVWTSQSSASNNNWSSICYGNGLFVAVAFSGTNSNRIMTSGKNLPLQNLFLKQVYTTTSPTMVDINDIESSALTEVSFQRVKITLTAVFGHSSADDPIFISLKRTNPDGSNYIIGGESGAYVVRFVASNVNSFGLTFIFYDTPPTEGYNVYNLMWRRLSTGTAYIGRRGLEATPVYHTNMSVEMIP
jgi:hypothetical protein